MRLILRACTRGITIPFSKTQATRIAIPRTAWLVANAHTMAAATTVPRRSMVHMWRRASGRSTRHRAADVCSTSDLKRAQQTATAGIIKRMTRIHSNAAILLWYTSAVEVDERQHLIPAAGAIEAHPPPSTSSREDSEGSAKRAHSSAAGVECSLGCGRKSRRLSSPRAEAISFRWVHRAYAGIRDRLVERDRAQVLT